LTDAHDDARAQRSVTSMSPERAAVRLTTFKDWAAVGRWYAEVERTAKAPTPEIRRKAEEVTVGRTGDLARLQALYEFVAGSFRYVSLSFGTGRYQPHASRDVLRNQYGDCKDKHTLLASLAESAGLRASAALMNSKVDLDPEFPSPSQFDHVITRAMADGREVWLDTTPEVAPFRLLSPSLRKKHVLLVEGGAGRLVETPEESPVPHALAVRVDGTLNESGSLVATAHLEFTGDFELVMRTIFRQTPKTEWKTVLTAIMAREGLDSQDARWNVSDPSAFGEPFAIEYQTTRKNFVTWTKQEFDLDLPLIDAMPGLRDTADEDETVELGPARRSTYTLHLTLPHGYRMHAPLALAVARDYGEYRADYALESQVFTVDRSLIVRQSQLQRDRRDDYRAFARVVSRDLRQKLALERDATAPVGVPTSWKADELYSSGYDALENGSYEQAIALLKRATEVQPDHRRAWDQLGRAYLEFGQLDAAIDALRKQIAINGYDLYAYNNLGRAYAAQHKYTDAEAAYQKQIEINPLDEYAHANLGKLYVDWQKDRPAVAELEKAIAISPKNATLRIRLGQAYLGLGDHDRARAAFDRAVEIHPDARSWNEIAYQLALHRVDLDLAHRYAESAVSSMTLKARNLSLGHITAWDLFYLSELGADWDTLGWVYFAEGNLVKAEKFVTASWLLLQNAEVGDHLAQIFEKLEKRNEAIRMYALALNAEHPEAKTRERMAALVGESQVDAIVRQHRDALERERTLTIGRSGPDGAKADVLLLLTSGSVEDVKFIEGDDRLRPLVESLRTIDYDPRLPDDGPTKIVRRGTVSCPSGPGPCRLVLMRPRDAQLAAQR
jgi:tetratricopeptide (TPR) repeat protein